MVTTVKPQEKEEFNRLAFHPLQSWEWGDFRQKTGIEVVRLGSYQKGKLAETAQLTIHRLPFTSWTIGYLPKSGIPSSEMLEKLVETGREYHCIFIKMEPHVKSVSSHLLFNSKFSIVPSPHPLFTNYTFQLDLTKSEEELLKNMHPKTRYNIKVAQRNNVKVSEEDNTSAFNDYLELVFETTRRQGFFAHTKTYHKLMWETLYPAGLAHLFTAKIQNEGKEQTLVAWIVFLFNNVLYYPYGASSDRFRNVMASNLMMWEVIRFGKRNKAVTFDMWGALGPNPDPKDPWFGFHKFKQGYGGKLTEFVGSFDLVINPAFYKIYNIMHHLRQFFLAVKSRLRQK